MKDLEKLLIQAAEKGAENILQKLHFNDENIQEDIRQARELLDAWRHAKQTAWDVIVRWMTTGFLGFIALKVYYLKEHD